MVLMVVIYCKYRHLQICNVEAFCSSTIAHRNERCTMFALKQLCNVGRTKSTVTKIAIKIIFFKKAFSACELYLRPCN